MGESLSASKERNITKPQLQMKTLQDQIKQLIDLKKQREIMWHRYYISDSQAILLEFIINEIKNWSYEKPIAIDIYFRLSNPDNLASRNIEELCHLFRDIILHKSKAENS